MLFHHKIYWPTQVQSLIPTGTLKLNYTNHARFESKIDRYGKINLPLHLNTSQALCIEAELDGNKRKFVFRMPFTNKHDLTMVLLKVNDGWLVKTCWLNSVNDQHKTLNSRNYVQPPIDMCR